MSRRYRRVEVRTWSDAGFRALSGPQPNAQSLWLALLTGERTTIIPGVVVGREAVLADDLRWPVEGFRAAFAEVHARGMARADWEAGLVYLPKALLDGHGEARATNRPNSANTFSAWLTAWHELPECPLKDEILRDLRALGEILGKGYVKAFEKVCGKALAKVSANACPSQDQEQKQDQKQEQEQERASRAGRAGRAGARARPPEVADEVSSPRAERAEPTDVVTPWPPEVAEEAAPARAERAEQIHALAQLYDDRGRELAQRHPCVHWRSKGTRGPQLIRELWTADSGYTFEQLQHAVRIAYVEADERARRDPGGEALGPPLHWYRGLWNHKVLDRLIDVPSEQAARAVVQAEHARKARASPGAGNAHRDIRVGAVLVGPTNPDDWPEGEQRL